MNDQITISEYMISPALQIWPHTCIKIELCIQKVKENVIAFERFGQV
jgi:hypothetical protein